jgi:hypothetical protein
MSGSGSQTNSGGGGFWKIHHAAIGIAILLLIVFAVRSCGNDAEEQADAEDGREEAIPRQAIVVEIPATQWQGQPAPVPQQAYPQAPVYPPQQPQYGYSAQQPYAQQPQYGYPVQQPPVQSQPAYRVDPENPWAVRRQQPLYGGASQYAQPQTPRWGQPAQQRPVYPQPGVSRFRPLDENQSTAPRQSAPATGSTVPRAVAPYDRLSGSSYGANTNAQATWPPGGSYPGYYGTMPYGGVPGGYPGSVYPGAVYPGGW